MRDEMDARIWNEHGQDFSASLHALLLDIGAGFRRLQAIRFAAPWKRGDVAGPGQA
jgi:hypothetical protein